MAQPPPGYPVPEKGFAYPPQQSVGGPQPLYQTNSAAYTNGFAPQPQAYGQQQYAQAYSQQPPAPAGYPHPQLGAVQQGYPAAAHNGWPPAPGYPPAPPGYPGGPPPGMMPVQQQQHHQHNPYGAPPQPYQAPGQMVMGQQQPQGSAGPAAPCCACCAGLFACCAACCILDSCCDLIFGEW